jgi:hypothetical protein
MDSDTLALILASQTEMKAAITDLAKEVSSINKGMVERTECATHRLELDSRLMRLGERVRVTEGVCNTYEATKDQAVDGLELQEAKEDAIRVSEERFDQAIAAINARLVDIDANIKFIDITRFGWQTVWGNPVLKLTVLGVLAGTYISILDAVGIYWGRIGQYGWQDVGIFLVTVLLISIGFWLSQRNNRIAATEATKKLVRQK